MHHHCAFYNMSESGVIVLIMAYYAFDLGLFAYHSKNSGTPFLVGGH